MSHRLKRRKKVLHPLAERTFAAFAPFVNVKCCGVKSSEGNPVYTTTQEQWDLYRRWRAGARNLFTAKGHKFDPRIGRDYLSKYKIDRQLRSGRPYYYTGGREGQTNITVDIDAHRPWQIDVEHVLAVVKDFLGEENLFVVPSDRGYHAELKIDYAGLTWKQANAVFKQFGAALHEYAKGKGCLCDIEIKGTITESDDHYGTLAKLPCYGEWTERRLAEYERLPVKSVKWLQAAIPALWERTDEAAARETKAICEELRRPQEVREALSLPTAPANRPCYAAGQLLELHQELACRRDAAAFDGTGLAGQLPSLVFRGRGKRAGAASAGCPALLVTGRRRGAAGLRGGPGVQDPDAARPAAGRTGRRGARVPGLQRH
jgi:hypothetical protein